MSTALVTGASSGIGLELARIFAEHGYDLVLVARNTERLERLGTELAGRHRIRATPLGADLSVPGAAERLVQQLTDRKLQVDVLMNNAGLGTYGLFVGTDLEATRGMLQVNVMALTELTRLLVPPMIGRKAGGVLNVASTAAFQPGPLMAAYYASKAYVLHFSEALGHELNGTGVTVTVLCPGPTRTAFQARASMEDSRLMKMGPLVMDAATVARKGFEGFRRGKRLVVPGLGNQLLRQSVRFTPRALVTWIASKVNAGAGGRGRPK